MCTAIDLDLSHCPRLNVSMEIKSSSMTFSLMTIYQIFGMEVIDLESSFRMEVSDLESSFRMRQKCLF